MFHLPKMKKKYIAETGYLEKERINVYRQHIRQPKYQQLAVEERLHTYGDGDWNIHIFPYSKILQDNKSQRKSYDDYLFYR